MRTRPTAPWREDEWIRLEGETLQRARARGTDRGAWEEIQRHCRRVLSAYSSSFFIVTRFLPPAKRAQVEVTYAAVRYPDEIVDTFPLTAAERLHGLRQWEDRYEQALTSGSLLEAMDEGVPTVLAAWASVVRNAGIPPHHYRAFLAAMRHDASPGPFSTLDDLIDGYIYGSAIVVGYFLAYIYGPARQRSFEPALAAARDLGIALQLTNFLRDVREDACRGRVYLPQDWLRSEGIGSLDVDDPAQHEAIRRVLRRMAGHAEQLYDSAQEGLDAFAEDSRVAIQACIDVYRQLNARIGRSPTGFLHREHVPFLDKYRVLPSSKYWRVPLAYLAG